MKLWVAYDKTAEHLPIAVADSAKRLSMMVGVSQTTVRTVALRVRQGDYSDERFMEVEVDEDD